VDHSAAGPSRVCYDPDRVCQALSQRGLWFVWDLSNAQADRLCPSRPCSRWRRRDGLDDLAPARPRCLRWQWLKFPGGFPHAQASLCCPRPSGFGRWGLCDFDTHIPARVCLRWLLNSYGAFHAQADRLCSSRPRSRWRCRNRVDADTPTRLRVRYLLTEAQMRKLIAFALLALALADGVSTVALQPAHAYCGANC
jgi:hypothetical protein